MDPSAYHCAPNTGQVCRAGAGVSGLVHLGLAPPKSGVAPQFFGCGNVAATWQSSTHKR